MSFASRAALLPRLIFRSLSGRSLPLSLLLRCFFLLCGLLTGPYREGFDALGNAAETSVNDAKTSVGNVALVLAAALQQHDLRIEQRQIAGEVAPIDCKEGRSLDTGGWLRANLTVPIGPPCCISPLACARTEEEVAEGPGGRRRR